MAARLASLRTSFRAIFITPVELKKSVIYSGTQQGFVIKESKATTRLNCTAQRFDSPGKDMMRMETHDDLHVGNAIQTRSTTTPTSTLPNKSLSALRQHVRRNRKTDLLGSLYTNTIKNYEIQAMGSGLIKKNCRPPIGANSSFCRNRVYDR
jgi:hypothetical protein